MNGLQLDKEEMEEQFETQYNEEYAKLDKSKKEFHLLKSKNCLTQITLTWCHTLSWDSGEDWW